MPRLPLLMAALILTVRFGGAAHAQADSISSARAIEAYVRDQMQAAHLPSVSVAVVRNGRTELLQAYGTANLEWGTAATPRTAYPLASATKLLTGTALMTLVEEGVISLDEPVTAHVPFAPQTWGAISIRHLTTHSSGISDDLGPGAPANAEEATRRVAERPLQFEPGSRNSYGIGGYAVLQYVIEQVTGETFPDVLLIRVLDPLGMAGTRFDHATNDGPFREADVIPERAGVYAWDGEAQHIFWFHFGSEAYTAGGLLSTAADLARWAAALDTGRLLSDERLEEMWGDFGPFGVGWVRGTYRGRDTVGHSGGPALADILRFPEERLTIIVLANQSRMYPYLAQGVADLLVTAVPEAPPPMLPDNAPEVTANVERLLGALARGEVIEEAFTEEAQKQFVPQLRAFLVPYARSLGAPMSLRLIEETKGEDEERTKRVYRVTYGEKTVDWSLEIAAEGAIVGMGPTTR